MYHSMKTKRTFITDEKIRNLHKNLSSFSWAKEKKEDIISNAEYYLSYGIDRILVMLAPQEIPRSYYGNQKYGCPNCGKETLKLKNGCWNTDYIKHPWKVICPNCGMLFPSNDFGKFYESGLDERGVFSYDRADRSLLVNELYPEKGENYAVDDGKGWVCDPSDPEHSRFAFIPHYNASVNWNHGESDKTSMAGLFALENLAQAYLITDDKKYGYAAAAIYYKFALLYSTMDISNCTWKDGYSYSDGSTNQGRILGAIYDTWLLNTAVEWYDMLFPCMDDGLIDYLKASCVRCIGRVPKNGAELCTAIEENMLLKIYPDYCAYTLNSNPGYPQMLLLKTALILDRSDLFDEYAEYIFKYIDRVRTYQFRYDMESLLISEVDRDGFAGEVAPAYNRGWAFAFMQIAEYLRGHKYDMFQNPKFRKLGAMTANYVCADEYTVSLADSEKCGFPGIFMDSDTQMRYFLAFGDPNIARTLMKCNPDGHICKDWFMDCEAVDQKIKACAGEEVFHSESRCLPGFGLAAIESHPDGKNAESCAVFFGSNCGHGHRDTMNLFLYGFGIDLMPDFGTPSFKTINPLYPRWEANMISHNTAMIPQTEPFSEEIANRPNAFFYDTIHCIKGGSLLHYYTDEKVSIIAADAPHLYDAPFRRTVVTVDLDGQSRYLADLFLVGGSNQRLSYHAVGVDPSVEGASFIPQGKGTYAGADIPYADPTYERYYATGFNYLTDVRRSTCPGLFTVDWKCEDNWHVWDRERDVHLKLHMLSDVSEAALCTGQPPQAKQGNPEAFTYLILENREGEANFVNVLEPYENASFLDYCEYHMEKGVQYIKVFHKNGRVDQIAVCYTGDRPVLTVESGNYHMTYGAKTLCGEVVSFTRDLTLENNITVRLDETVDAQLLTGRFVTIAADTAPNAVYEIVGAKPIENGLWNLDVGDCTTISGYKDRTQKEKGYAYYFSEGSKLTITL